jgi:murein DD-endopeptidase MepM/ murein hydrolase activator NlpD
MKRLFLVSALTASALALTPAHADTSPSLEIRFCPEAGARAYPLDSLRGVQGLLLQNIAVVNRGATPAEVEAVEIELLRGGEVVDARRVSGAAITAAVKGGQGLKASGMMELLPGQWCDGRLLDGAAPAASAALGRSEALLLSPQTFAWRGGRDEARVRVMARADGKPVTASASVRIDSAAGSKTAFRWPLRGGPWIVAAGASFHTAHRWGVTEEFALDIVKVGPDGRSHRAEGARHTDFWAYDAEVVAAADGVVALVIDGAVEHPPLLRRPGESMDAYYGRIGAQQAANLAQGLKGAVGEGVVIDHGNGEYSSYSHLRPGSVTVKPGQAVKAGEAIGRLGSSGNSTEPHLHFQVCDRAQPLSCASIVPTFDGIELPLSDGPRPLQSGDIVRAQD